MHEAARWVVQARSEHFLTKEGLPDYSGRSWEYRSWFSDVTNSLDLSDLERSRLMSRLRFHVGNHLRNEVREEELAEAGLLKVSPAQRGKRNYEHRSLPYRIITSGRKLTTDEEIAQVTEILYSLSVRLDTSKVSKATRHELKETLADLAKRI